MANNLRAKIPTGDTLLIYDRNTDATKKFLAEAAQGKAVEVAENPREVAEKSVSHFILQDLSSRFM